KFGAESARDKRPWIVAAQIGFDASRYHYTHFLGAISQSWRGFGRTNETTRFHYRNCISDFVAVRSSRAAAGAAGDRISQQWEAASRMPACGARGGVGDWPDVREHAASVPGWEGSYQRRRAVELDTAVAGGLGPGELAGVPFYAGFGFSRDVEVLVEAGMCLADLGISELDE